MLTEIDSKAIIQKVLPWLIRKSFPQYTKEVFTRGGDLLNHNQGKSLKVRPVV